jgi:hypothetical protein
MALCMLLLSLAIALQAPSPARPAGTTPRNVKGDTSPNGITVTAPDDGFIIEIPGKLFKALSSDRLVWSIDAMTVELLVASPSPLLPDSATDAAILRDYRRPNAGADDETLSTSRGLTGVLWTSGDRGAVAAVVIGRRVAVLSATQSAGGTVAQAREYLKSAMSTLRPMAKADTRDPRRDPDVASSGMTLQGQLRVQGALYGKPHVGLLSAKLGTETDKRVSGAMVVDHATLVEIARLLQGIGQSSLTVSIFDGRQAHAINIDGYDFKTETFEYWDPWGKGSFLERENNAAGVAARAHPSKARIWLISFDEMARILYSIVLPMDTVIGVFRLATLAAGPPEKVVATYRALYSATPDLEELAPERLEREAKYLMAAGKPDAATALLAARLALHPTAPIAGISIDDARVRALAAPGAQPRRPREPQRLEPAKRQDFFTFFHLEQTGIDGAVTRFRPSREKFRPLVEVAMTTKSDGTITARELRLDRKFIDDPALTMFAQDIARSFLSFSVDASETSALKGVNDELWQRDRPRVPIPGGRVPGATIPALPSPAYMTYLGQHPSLELLLPASVITMRNVSRSGGRDLVITVVNR